MPEPGPDHAPPAPTASPRRLPVQAPDYPAGLSRLPRPPTLWVLGQAPEGPLVAVVGTRRADLEGLELARRLASALVERGYGIISGLAPGVDTAAHRAAVDAGGRTWAFVGGGVDRAVCAEDPGLPARMLATGGGILAEVPPGTETEARWLVARNRLQAAASLATVVVQSEIGSGTMHTARFALGQHRPLVVFQPPPPASGRVGPAWSGNQALVDPHGAPASVLHARGGLGRAIEQRRPVADLVLSGRGDWSRLWSLLRSLPPVAPGLG